MIKKTILEKSSLLKRVNRENTFVKNIISKPTKIFSKIEKKLSFKKTIGISTHLFDKKLTKISKKSTAKDGSKLEKTLMPSGSVNTLDGYWKNKYEKFLGVTLPNIRVHYDHNAIAKTQRYKARSFAQGANIYLGKDVKPIDTLEGQMTMAHELTHVLQQKYLDMSSGNKEMIDPNIELEKRAKGIEGIVKFRRGIDETASALIKRRDLLPFRSYNVPMLEGNKYLASNIIQRKRDLFITKDKNKKAAVTKANLLDADNYNNIFINSLTSFSEYKDVLTHKEFLILKRQAILSGVTIEIRELSAQAKKNRESDSLPKPMAIKQKTLRQDDIDYLLVGKQKKNLKNQLAKVAIFNPRGTSNGYGEKAFQKNLEKGLNREVKNKDFKDIQNKIKEDIRDDIKEKHLAFLRKNNKGLTDVDLLYKLKDFEYSDSFKKEYSKTLEETFKNQDKKILEKRYINIRKKEVINLRNSRKKDYLEYQKADKRTLIYRVNNKGLVISRKKGGKTYTSDLDMHSVTLTNLLNKDGKKITNQERTFIEQDKKSRAITLSVTQDLIDNKDSHVEHGATNQSWMPTKIKASTFKRMITTKKRNYSGSEVPHYLDMLYIPISKRKSYIPKSSQVPKVRQKAFVLNNQKISKNKYKHKNNLINDILLRYDNKKYSKGSNTSNLEVYSIQTSLLMRAQSYKDRTKRYQAMSDYFMFNALSLDGRSSEAKKLKDKAKKFALYASKGPATQKDSDNPKNPNDDFDGKNYSTDDNKESSDNSKKFNAKDIFHKYLKHGKKAFTFVNKHKGGGNLKKLQGQYQKTKDFTSKLLKGKLEIGDVDEALQFASKNLDPKKLQDMSKNIDGFAKQFNSKKFENLSKKFESKKFVKFSKRLNKSSKFVSKLKKASDVKKLLSGEASASDAIGLTKDGMEFAQKRFKKFKKMPKFGKASKFLGFLQKIVGVFDKGILGKPLELAKLTAGAIGDFIGSIAGKIGGKVIAGVIASATAGIGTLLYPLTSYFGGMLVEGGIGILYDKYAKSPIIQKIHHFAKNSIDSIEENFPTIGHLINGRYLDFFKGMFSFIKPKAIYNFIDNFMTKQFPIVWRGAKFAGTVLKKTGEFIGEKIYDGVQGIKKLGSSIWGGLKSFGSSLWGGTKKLASTGLKYAKQGAKWVGDKAGKAWSGVKSVGSSIWGGLKSFGGSLWGGAKKMASKGLNYAKQGVKWVGDKAGKAWSGVKSVGSSIWSRVKKGATSFGERAKSRWSSIKSMGSSLWNRAKKGAEWFGDRAKKRWSGVKDVYKQGEKYTNLATKWSVKNAGSLISQSEKIGSSIGSSVGNGISSRTTSFAVPSISSVSSAVNREESHRIEKPSIRSAKSQDSSYSFIIDRSNDEAEKYAEVSRNQGGSKTETPQGQTTQQGMDNQVDELSMKIFRHLKNEIALEFARSR